MSSFNFDNDEEDEPKDVNELVEQYEQSLQNNQAPFFEQDDFESIIEYYELKGQFDKALEVAEKSLAQHPYSSALLLKKACLFFELKQLDNALEFLNKVELYDSNELGVYFLRAEIFAFQSKFEDAIRILEELETKTADQDLTDVYLQMCDVYEDWEKYTDVYNCLIKCLQVDPNNEEAINRLNYCIEITDKYKESIPFINWLIDQNPYNQFAWYNLAGCYQGIHQYEEAIHAYEYVLAINEDADFVYQDMAELHYEKGNYHKALEVIKEMLEIFDADDEIYFLQGKCYEALDDMKMARYCYRKAVHENPSLSEAYFRIGETYKNEKLWEQAYKAFQKANELEKEQYDFCLAMAVAATEIGELEVAMDACETAIDIFVKRHEAYILLAKIMAFNSSDLTTAKDILLKGIELCKSTVELEYALCAVTFMENKIKEASLLLRNLMLEHSTQLECLFDFNEYLAENKIVIDIIAEFN